MKITLIITSLGLFLLSSCGPEAVAKRRAGLAPYTSKAPGSFDLERSERQAEEEDRLLIQ